MITTHDSYAVFEANQVLTNAHLNDTFDYLDEQQRLTRANLIGTGIACGFEVSHDAATIRIAKGVGITSQGYLIMEPADVTLTSWRPYTLPAELPYPTFQNTAVPPQQYGLWELFPAGEPGATALSANALNLQDKAVVLFLELKKDSLRICSPASCDDRGAAVTATVRRLLVHVADLDAALTRLQGAAAAGTEVDLGDRLALPDLRLPRVDVQATDLVTTEDVLAAFRSALGGGLVGRMAAALSAAYAAFRPLLLPAYPTDPFTGFAGAFGFLDGDLEDAQQARFLPYYWDLFDDLIRGYDEFRWAGLDLLCACCPPDSLFPRHLMLGVLGPSAHPGRYRHGFTPSPAVSVCEERAQAVRLLFGRLVGMAADFSNRPEGKAIRATPSRWGTGTLADTAIPYYYVQDGTPPIRTVWNPELTRRQRTQHNLSYRAGGYGPNTPDFVTEPLRYELEPHNFLRIEGHLGVDFRKATSALLDLRTRYRLPIEVVALRTGAFDENAPIDLAAEGCRFQDLDTLYATLRAELICFLCKEVRWFYGLSSPAPRDLPDPKDATLPLLLSCEPGYQVEPGNFGWVIEDLLAESGGIAFRVALKGDGFTLDAVALVAAMDDLAQWLDPDLREVDVARLVRAYERLVTRANLFEQHRLQDPDDAGEPGYAIAGLPQRLAEILHRCKLEAFRVLAAEYRRRAREAKQSQYLSTFLHRHPGIQHKAGVPLGGTFVLVYHDSDPVQAAPSTVAVGVVTAAAPDEVAFGPVTAEDDRTVVTERDAGAPKGKRQTSRWSTIGEEKERSYQDAELEELLTELRKDPALAVEPAIQRLFLTLTGRVLVVPAAQPGAGGQVLADAVADLPDGTVIADFFLPYLCSSDCPPIQFSLPAPRPRLEVKVGCTDPQGHAEVTVVAPGATGAVSVQVDGGPFEASTGKLSLPAGPHTIVIRDDTGAESTPAAVRVPQPLALGAAETEAGGDSFRVRLQISGGTPPYRADSGTVDGDRWTSADIPKGDVLTLSVTDAAECSVSGSFRHAGCDLPCGGVARRDGYRFWIPEARARLPLKEYAAEIVELRVRGEGSVFDLSAEAAAIVSRPNLLTSTTFERVVTRWLDALNELIAQAVGSDQWVRLGYEQADEGATTGTLRIERLACVDVEFELEVTYTQGRAVRTVRTAYDTREGTKISDLRAQWAVRIPPFDPATANWCRPAEPWVAQCGDVDLAAEIDATANNDDTVVLTARQEGGTETIASYLWEVQDGNPPLGDQERQEFGFDPVEPRAKAVRLTVFTPAGCAVTVTRTVKLGGG